jgi:DUF2075 family protein
MTIDLEQITFGPMEESLKQEIKTDISNFKLSLFEDKMSVNLYLKSKEDITINCGAIMSFKYPEKSQEQRMDNPSILIGYNRAINIHFLYNNKNYTIQGCI